MPKFLTHTEKGESGIIIKGLCIDSTSHTSRIAPVSNQPMTQENPAMYAKGKGTTAPSDNQAREK